MQSKTFYGLKIARVGLLLAALGWASQSMADIILFDFGMNVDGTTTCGSADGYCDVEGVSDLSGTGATDLLDYFTGLGTLSLSMTGAGAHSVSLFVDHEMSEATNTYYNESGSATGTASAGQVWEIDEPGWVFGDIFDNFLDATLDNSNAVPAGLEDDVSMALGWNFTLAAGEIASIDFLLSTIMPTAGFFLAHLDADSNEVVYFSSTLNISSVSVPEPGTAALLGAGLLGIGLLRRRRLVAAAG